MLSALASVALLAGAASLPAQAQPPSSAPQVMVLEIKGTVEVVRAGRLTIATTNQVLLSGDRLRTGLNSRATVLVPGQGPVIVSELSELEMPPAEERRPVLRFLKGLLYFFHRGQPREMELRTPTALAVVLGTEFSLRVEPDGRTVLLLFDGEVEMTTDLGPVRLTSGEQGVAAPGQAPVKSPIVEVLNDLIQWFLYYPGVLDVDEIGLDARERAELADSLAAYRSGDLPGALVNSPVDHQPASDRQRIYFAALLLSVGQVGKAEALLKAIPPEPERPAQLAAALRQLIATVKGRRDPSTLNPQLSTSLLTASYDHQSRGDLEQALAAARDATRRSPRFGFAWARVAELEFSFGRQRQMREALQQALTLSPRNAQALTLQGFLLSAENRTAAALAAFDQALALDAGLGNAWLGRGLCHIRQGRSVDGLRDLQVGAALEPQRAVLRSYLGKAFSQAGQADLAARELRLAQKIDPKDPTAWLYSALLALQNNRINDAVRDLEHAQELNQNRQIYRSRHLLDQDRAVRGANLANIYLDAGMSDVSVREAVRAVNADYLNYSAHWFLANSYDGLRDPRQFNLRYETPWLTEYLLANLLAPVGAGTLSQTVSQQEYSRLFERDRFGIASRTEYISRGDWSQGAAQFGTIGNLGYALDTAYRSLNGERPNNDLELFTASLSLKHQLTAQDSFFFQGTYATTEAGDVQQYYDPASARLGLRVTDAQEPLLLAGYHREWAPGSHTLVLGGYVRDTVTANDPANQPVLLLGTTNANGIVVALPYPALPEARLNYRNESELFTAEAQHLLRAGDHSLVAGARYQGGTFHTRDSLGPTVAGGFAGRTFTNQQSFPVLPVARDFQTTLERASVYGYDHWQIREWLLLAAGLSYDWLEYPLNFRSPPTSPGQTSTDQLSPKAGLIWTPGAGLTVRAGYARALGGVSFEQSFRLEPSQVAGFNQALRSAIPESVAGSAAGEQFDIWGLSLEQKFGTGTYLGLRLEWLESDAQREEGAIDNPGGFIFFGRPTHTSQRLNFRERDLDLTFNQLLGREWSAGAAYRLSDAELDSRYSDILDTVGPYASREEAATLHQLHCFVLYQHPVGVFAQFDSLWTHQVNRDAASHLPNEDFWQFNLQTGYRFPRRRAEVRVGLLNLTGQDYRLNPLNLTTELPRERALLVSFRFNF